MTVSTFSDFSRSASPYSDSGYEGSDEFSRCSSVSEDSMSIEVRIARTQAQTLFTPANSREISQSRSSKSDASFDEIKAVCCNDPRCANRPEEDLTFELQSDEKSEPHSEISESRETVTFVIESQARPVSRISIPQESSIESTVDSEPEDSSSLINSRCPVLFLTCCVASAIFLAGSGALGYYISRV